MDDDQIGKEEMAAIVRDNIHNLNVSDPNANKMFENYMQRFFAKLEGFYLEAYDDRVGAKNGANLVRNIIAAGQPITGKITVGIGFNMDNEKGAREEWREAEICKSFDEVRSGKIKLTKEEVTQLFNVSIDNRIAKLKKEEYRGAWEIFRPNEKNLPDNKMPGCDYGCRCWAEPVPSVVFIVRNKFVRPGKMMYKFTSFKDAEIRIVAS